MSATSLHGRLSALADVEARLDEPLAKHTTYKVGGPARHFIVVDTLEALQAVLSVLHSAGTPWLVLGNGSNVLFADAGFSGAVMTLGKGFDTIALERDGYGDGRHRLQVGAALSITRLLRFTKREQLGGVEALGGVPATIGGAVRMNAGTRLGEVSDSLVEAQVVTANAAPSWTSNAQLKLSYRRSGLPEGAVITAARFEVSDASAEMRQRLDEVLAYRKSTQPLQLPSCGSVFANPPGDAAGRLIESVGLKGRTVGGAQISEQHANWIVNLGGATADDIHRLIRLCVDEVEAQHGVTLRREVQLLGDWEVA